jgi:hypothetical protein
MSVIQDFSLELQRILEFTEYTTVPKVIADITIVIVENSPLRIKFPSTEDEFEAAKADWQVSYKFPCAVGALDCTHIPIRKPSVHGDEYINRKGLPSVNVQATCNSQELFISMDVSWPGSVHGEFGEIQTLTEQLEKILPCNSVGERGVRFSAMADDSF